MTLRQASGKRESVHCDPWVFLGCVHDKIVKVKYLLVTICFCLGLGPQSYGTESNPQPQVSHVEFCARAFGGILDGMRRGGLIDPSLASLSLEDAPTYAQLALAHLADHHPAAAELAHILALHSGADPVGKTGSLRKEIDEWRLRHNIGFEPIYVDGIGRRIDELKKSGLVTTDQYQIGPAGLLTMRPWSYLVADKKLPCIDPHDVLTHLPSFLLPGFESAFQSVARTRLKWHRKLPMDGIYSSPNVIEKLKNVLLTLQWMAGPLRNHTYESLMFIEGKGSSARLVVHGNDVTTFADLVKKGKGLTTKDWVEAFFPELRPIHDMSVYELPNMREFLKTKGDRGQRFERLLQDFGMEQPGLSEQKARFAKLIEKIPVGPEEGELEVNRVSRVMNLIASSVSSSPELMRYFSSENRIELMRESATLIDEYLVWRATIDGFSPE